MIALRVARAVKGWSAGEVADITGMRSAAIRDVETGKYLPSPSTLSILRAAYGDDLATAEMHYGSVQTRERGAPRKST